jgi:hypothetical protein
MKESSGKSPFGREKTSNSGDRKGVVHNRGVRTPKIMAFTSRPIYFLQPVWTVQIIDIPDDNPRTLAHLKPAHTGDTPPLIGLITQ